VCQGVYEQRGLLWVGAGVIALGAYGFVATFRPDPNWSLKARDEERIAAATDEYRSALIKWNDSLNRNLALAYRYFGRDVWAFLSRTTSTRRFPSPALRMSAYLTRSD